MAYSYTPTYYSSLHDSITSICKNILPFSFKKKRLPAIAAAEQRLAKQQSDNLKWQQESFHQILNLMGLCKEGILHENEVSAFRAHLLETLVALPLDYEAPVIVRDKLIFLQELLYTKCISEDEYHKSKMPLLQMLAVQGAEIRERDVVAAPHKQILNEEWPVTDLNLKEKKGLINSENLVQRNQLKEGSTTKKINGTSSTSDLVLRHNNGKLKEDNKDASDPGAYDVRPGNRNISTTSVSRNELITSTENPFWNNHVDEKESESKSILVMETLTEASVKAEQTGSAKGKRKPFRALFQRDQKAGQGDCGNERDPAIEEKEKVKPVKKTWGFDGFRKWKKSDIEDETAPLSLIEKSDGANPVETKQMKKELHPHGLMADTFPDKVLREDIKEQSRIQTELSARTAHFHLLGDHNEEISTRPPVDNADPKKIFQKSWSNQHGDSKLDVIEKELKVGKDDGELGNSPGLGREKHNSKRWTTFDDEENSHPNLFAPQASHSWSRNARTSFNSSSSSSSIDKGFRYNPFFDM